MGTPVIILGGSGRGKSTSLRNLNPMDCVLIQAIDKQLPFIQIEGKAAYNGKDWKLWSKDKNPDGSRFVTDNTATILQILAGTKKRNIIIIDDFQYIMANEFMRRSSEVGFNKFTEIGRNAWQLLQQATNLDADKRVYFMWHEDQDDFGQIRTKTIGKMLNEKIVPEGMVSICLRAFKNDGGYWFQTQSNGSDPCKAPMGMFDRDTIENDLKIVDDAIVEYYELSKPEKA